MANLLTSLPPALWFFAGACIVPFLKDKIRQVFVICLALFGFMYIAQLNVDASLQFSFIGQNLSLLRVDAWSKIFGYVFTLSAFATFIYGFYQKKRLEHTSALLYIGSALGVVFSGDLFSVYIFWELLAITSVFLILLKGSLKSRKAAQRYIVVQIGRAHV